MTNKDSKEKVNKSINDAISSMDFDDISKKIKQGVDQAINSTMNLIGGSKAPAIQTKNSKVCAQKPPEKSKSSGFKFLAVLLGMIAFASGFSVISNLTAGGYLGSVVSDFILCLASGIGTAFFWTKAKFLDNISKNYARFLRELGHNTVIPVRDLASAVQQSEEDTVNDLLYMMQNGYFHQARIVENDSLFILDIDTFKLYKNQAAKIDRTEEKKISESRDDQRAQNIITNGNIYLDKIEKSKEKIKNGVFLEKTDKLSKTIENILSLIQKYPDKAYALDKFMDYYLPTTAKLVDTYIEFEEMNTGDVKINSSMKEIDKSVGTINEAFEKIQVELLSDRAMDIKTDIDTMKLLLNQEGLLEDDWSKE